MCDVYNGSKTECSGQNCKKNHAYIYLMNCKNAEESKLQKIIAN